MGTYSIVKKADRLAISVKGHMDTPTAEKFVNEYKQQVSKIIPSQYILDVDGNELSVVTADMQESLKSCFKLYQSTGFKKVILHINKSNAILSMQVKRIASAAGLQNFSIVS
ncbi:MAG: hypothetical protein PHE09_07290 [Oscillospiraceae bacterium]|nr:hypothetical protein [Oscillospiraceae bacterium]